MRISFQVALLSTTAAVLACSAGGGGEAPRNSGSSGSSALGNGGSGGVVQGTSGSGGVLSSQGGSGPSGTSGSGGSIGGGAAPGAGTAGVTAGTGAGGGLGSAGIGGGGVSSQGGAAGSAPVAGSAGTGTGSGGGGPIGNAPPGYWTYKDWHGCVWTGVDTVTTDPKSTITPQDFTMVAAGGPYHVTGTVGHEAMFQGVALLGFNLNQPAEGTSCVYNPAAATAKGPPAVTFPTGPTGIAVNFSKTDTGVVRIQMQGENGATDENDRWCYTLTAVQGKDFAPFDRFYTKCWNDTPNATESPGNKYKGEPISAVVFSVPGDSKNDLKFDFTVNGFALGTSADDAPDGGMAGSISGTLGGTDPNGEKAHDFQRVKVQAEGHSYVIQNNNWGNPTGTDQTISYKDNSFKITSITGGDLGPGQVRSFPSIYIGSNGNTMSGALSTFNDDSLPKKNSAIQSVATTFNWSGGTAGGNYNVTYDVWFAADPPAAAFPFYPEYQDGKSGFLMVWFYKPGANGPIGDVKRMATVEGKQFQVYSGPRGTGPSPNAPVVSYVATATIQSWSFDLNNFIKDAVANAAQDANGGIKGDWYLTDVFAGFEIWNGQNAQGLSVDKFTAVVK